MRPNTEIDKINADLIKLVQEYNLTYIDLTKAFKAENGKLNPGYSIDGLHLNGRGYYKWKELIENYVNE